MSNTRYRDEGTIAHQLAAMCLTANTDASAYIGRLLESEDYQHASLSPSSAARHLNCLGSYALEQVNPKEFVPRFFAMEATEEMAEYVQLYVDFIRERVEAYTLAGAQVVLLVEQPLQIGHITGEEGATGTGDVIIIAVWPGGSATLDVVDLKTGRGVIVEPEDNEQLSMYGCGALHEHGLFYNFTEINLIIHQPRVARIPQEWKITPDDLAEFQAKATAKYEAIRGLSACEEEDRFNATRYLTPGEKQCQFCPNKPCEAQDAYVQNAVGADFQEIVEWAETGGGAPAPATASEEALSAKMKAVAIVEDWCAAVRKEAYKRLSNGVEVPDFKMVAGRKGDRKWEDEKKAEAEFKAMRIKKDEMYTHKLKSPAQAEKMFKDNPKRWARLEGMITQDDGKPIVVPITDKRAAITVTPAEDDFDNLEE